jgi:hypothetical protein
MKVKFKPTEVMAGYHSDDPYLHCETAGVYECSAEKAAQVCSDFPNNFEAVGEKAEAVPAANKMQPGPGKNK